MPRVLIADKLSPAAIDIFKQRGVDADVKTGLSKEELLKIINDYDGLAVRSATKADKYTVTGTLKEPSLSATASLTVVPGPPTKLKLDPEKAEIPAGAGQPYKAVTEDRFGNETDVTAQTGRDRDHLRRPVPLRPRRRSGLARNCLRIAPPHQQLPVLAGIKSGRDDTGGLHCSSALRDARSSLPFEPSGRLSASCGAWLAWVRTATPA